MLKSYPRFACLLQKGLAIGVSLVISLFCLWCAPVHADAGMAEPVNPSAFNPSTINSALEPTGEATQTLKIDGTQLMRSINERLKQQYEAEHPDTQVYLKTNGTEAALDALLKDDIDLAAIGRPLTEEEKARGLKEIPITQDQIALIMGRGNSFRGHLTLEQVSQIVQGKITNWADVGGVPGLIRWIERPVTSDTRQTLLRYLGLDGIELSPGETVTQLSVDDTAEVIRALKTDGLSYAIANQVRDLDTVRLVKIAILQDTLPGDGLYPYTQLRGYAYKRSPSPALQSFLGFSTAEPGQEAVEAAKQTEAKAVAEALNPRRRPVVSTADESGQEVEGGAPWWALALLPLALLPLLPLWLGRRSASSEAKGGAGESASETPGVSTPTSPPVPTETQTMRMPESRVTERPEPAAMESAPGIADEELDAEMETIFGAAIAPPTVPPTVPTGESGPVITPPAIASDSEPITPTPPVVTSADVETPDVTMPVVGTPEVETPQIARLESPATEVTPFAIAPEDTPVTSPVVDASEVETPQIAAPEAPAPEVAPFAIASEDTAVTPPVVGTPEVETPQIAMPEAPAAEVAPFAIAPPTETPDIATPDVAAPVELTQEEPPAEPLPAIAPPADVVIPATAPLLDLVVLLGTGATAPELVRNLSGVAQSAFGSAVRDRPADIRLTWLGVESTPEQTYVDQTLRTYLLETCGVDPARLERQTESTANLADVQALTDLATHFNWRPDAARAVFFVGDEPTEGDSYGRAALDGAVEGAIAAVRDQGLIVHTLTRTPYDQTLGDIPSPLSRLSQTSGGFHFTAQDADRGLDEILKYVVDGSCRVCAHRRLIVNSRRDCYELEGSQIEALQSTANSVTLEPGDYVIRIREGSFSYWSADPLFDPEPWVVLWIYGGRFLNRATDVEVGATWATLNGYDDVLKLKVLEPTTLSALFFDTYRDDNSGQVVLSILEM